mmetsp:Transcript_54161/g.126027  ORF Transcript_54161/g.126027 Transcript_54161/m.126027 type:complete len:698 (+) Transcript_54161:107-2200(+)|eukprot:CAMPEP_0171062156 /NCGR_PEP_ID=MMETSP0766_2-20121228/4900_1 /TAXON_ID=439317 /ORGANISM="Gambierdiscus australes, Strain CAWD 149" /LENGTH=697 /DNA_ID=CAMNT_0011517941 /DNA_START=33 /DNA_END=2126 /DNA_ORIENTATION=-
MAGTMVYMLALLALASGMVVLMFGFFSSTHTSMYALQASFDEHDRLLRRVRQADSEISGQFSELRRTVEELRSKVQLQQAAIDTQGEALSTSKPGVAQGELSKQVQEAQQDVARLREELQKVAALQEDLRTPQPQSTKEPSPSVDTRAFASEQKVSELASKQQALFRLLNSHDEAQHRLQELVEHLNQTVGEIQLTLALVARPVSAAAVTNEPSPGRPGAVAARTLGGEERTNSQASNPRTTTSVLEQAASQQAKVASAVVSWYRECGCTGMEIEAVTLLVSLANRTGVARVRTNKCSDTCTWPASTRALLDRIEVEEESQLADPAKRSGSQQGDVSPATIVLVVHAAFDGVCMMPTRLILPSRSSEDLISEPQRGLFRVSRSMLETDRVDEDRVSTCNEQFDAVWVPSQFNVHTFSKSGVKKSMLHVLPEAIDTTLYNCSSGAPPEHHTHRTRFGVPQLDDFLARGADESTFTFLSIFKWEDRKNWKELLTSFHATFPQNVTDVSMENGRKVSVTVRLLIKTQALSWGTDPHQDLADLLSTLGASASSTLSERLLIVKESLSSVSMPSLYLMADAFVLPTHGEGWGLPLMEAMASGLPTIATNWGGQTEFMNDRNAFVLGYDLVDSNSIVNSGGHLWAAPKTKELRQAMWDVIARPSLARLKAQRGCREIQEQYTAQSAAQKTLDLIAELHREIPK